MTPGAPDAVSPPPAGDLRRPGTAARFLLFLLAASSLTLLFSVAFPPGVPDRLPILAITLLLALAAARRPEAGVCAFALLLPLSGLLARAFGGTDASAWPVLLFAGLATGWTFRFLYDFESRPDPSEVDGALRALALLWTLATLLSLLRARTLWALIRGLSGRIVNQDGLPEAAAAQESLMTFAVLAAGAGFFFLLRRSGAATRVGAAAAFAAGAALSGVVAVLEAAKLLPWETREFWRFTGRISGGAVDPNTLGMIAALAIPLLATLAARDRGAGRVAWAAGLLFAGAGVLLSGSRSALLVLMVAAGAAIAGMFARRARGAVLLASATAVILVAGLFALPGKGGLGARLAATFDASKSAGDRLSSRPLLWKSAIAEFRQDPVEGGGLGSFSWRLPDLAATGERFRMRDNPGSAYLQALAETGLAGFALTIWFVVVAAVMALRA
ncbi:MAG TPA: O-antigen ligase family protein, partial [Thermoanaerobaculia bacterium]